MERTEAAVAAFGRERRRNAELVHRLQQLHGEQVDTLELKRRCVGEGEAGRAPKYGSTWSSTLLVPSILHSALPHTFG